MVINELYRQMCALMAENENSDPQFEANLLIEYVLGKKRIELLGADICEEDAKRLMDYAQQRREGYPLQYILGRWYFFDMELFVGEGVLVPRQDTETVCEAAFEAVDSTEKPKVLDLCSGSGCIALAVKKYCPHADVTAVEKSDEAYKYLVKNIGYTSLDVTPLQADVLALDKQLEKNSIDVIVSNPPYIHPDLRGRLQTEVNHEPEMALFAEEDGLLFYRHIAQEYKAVLKDKGYLVFEYGFDQQTAVRNILVQAGYNIIKEIIDFGGNPRGVVAQKQ
ncbi:MAG: peptide chain release factor N(5)-glutamine methyltransferase [Oscillospiraceae bacterium]|nr:peptide chain release factor N(5)-glutamine methyltransferase [Oscillospiraceae bacterium]